jgi:P27 family predicted phage terminase small subunit
MSNPPVPFIVAKLKGSPGKRATRQAPEPAAFERCPEAPSYLPEHARQEWDRVAPGLWAIGLITVVDTACLAAYCSSYAMWRRASEELESLTVETRAGDLRRHPLIKVIADAASDMVRADAGCPHPDRARPQAAAEQVRGPAGRRIGGAMTFDIAWNRRRQQWRRQQGAPWIVAAILTERVLARSCGSSLALPASTRSASTMSASAIFSGHRRARDSASCGD